MIGRPPEEVVGEVAFIAYHFHWPQEEIMRLDHGLRRQWVAEISAINRRLDEGEQGAPAWP